MHGSQLSLCHKEPARSKAPPGQRDLQLAGDQGEGAVVVQPPHLPRHHRVERYRDLCQRRHPEFYLENVVAQPLLYLTITVTKQMCNKYANNKNVKVMLLVSFSKV